MVKFIQLLSLPNPQGSELCALALDGSVWVWHAAERKWTELKAPLLRSVPAIPETDRGLDGELS